MGTTLAGPRRGARLRAVRLTAPEVRRSSRGLLEQPLLLVTVGRTIASEKRVSYTFCARASDHGGLGRKHRSTRSLRITLTELGAHGDEHPCVELEASGLHRALPRPRGIPVEDELVPGRCDLECAERREIEPVADVAGGHTELRAVERRAALVRAAGSEQERERERDERGVKRGADHNVPLVPAKRKVKVEAHTTLQRAAEARFTWYSRGVRRGICLIPLLIVAACSAFSGSDTSSPSGSGGPDAGSRPDGEVGQTEDGGVILQELDGGGGVPSADASPGDSGGGGVPIDCTAHADALFCNDFDGRDAESPYTTSPSGLDASVSTVHSVSPVGSMLVDSVGYATFVGNPGAQPWTVSFDVWLDASVAPNLTFANISRAPGVITFTTTAGGFKVNSTLFTAPSGWSHILLQAPTASASVEVTVNGKSQPVGFTASAADLNVKLGCTGALSPIWFDDVLATSP